MKSKARWTYEVFSIEGEKNRSLVIVPCDTLAEALAGAFRDVTHYIGACRHTIAVVFHEKHKSCGVSGAITGASSASTVTPSKANATVIPDILEEIRRIKEQNTEILRLMRMARDRRWYALQDAGERLGRAAWTLRQLCSHGKIRAEKGEDGQWRISADELTRLEQDGVPKLPNRPPK